MLGMKNAGDEEARGQKTGNESEKMKCPGMKCHAAVKVGICCFIIPSQI